MSKHKEFLISESVGLEALRVQVSNIGIGKYAKHARRFRLISGLISESLIGKLFGRYCIKPFDGYIINFNSINVDAIRISVPKVIAMFGPEKSYNCSFLSYFEDVRQLSYRRVENPQSIYETLDRAFGKARKVKTGFLVLAVEGNKYRPKDILIWNQITGTWISYNHSKAYAMRHYKTKLLEDFAESNVYWLRCLDSQGVIVRPDNYHEPKSVRVSLDGLIWNEFPIMRGIKNDIGIDIWNAWNSKVRIYYDRHLHTFQYTCNSNAGWYSTYKNLLTAQSAWESGYEAVELSPDEMYFLLDKKDFPNLFVRMPYGTLSPFVSLTETEKFREEPVGFLNKLKEFAADMYKSNPNQRFIILKDIVEDGRFYDLSDFIVTEDGKLIEIDFD